MAASSRRNNYHSASNYFYWYYSVVAVGAIPKTKPTKVVAIPAEIAVLLSPHLQLLLKGSDHHEQRVMKKVLFAKKDSNR